MDLPALNKSENLIREMPNIFVKSKGYRLFLTNERVLLRDNDLPDSVQVDVPLSLIENAVAGNNKAGEQVIILSISSPEAKHRKMILSLPRKNGEARTDECKMLKEAFDEAFALTGRTPAAPVASRAEKAKPKEGAPNGQSCPESRGKVILESPNIFIKSQEFTAVLTDAKLTLRSTGKDAAPTVEIERNLIHGAKAGDNPAHEPTIELSVQSEDGRDRKMVLSFSLWFNGERAAERDQWIKIITGCCPLPPVESITHPPNETPESARNGNYEDIPGPITHKCPECGETIQNNARFCYSCGAKLDGSGRKPEIKKKKHSSLKELISGNKIAAGQKKQKKPRLQPGVHDDCLPIENPSLMDKYALFLFGPDRASRLTRTEDIRDALPYLLLVLAVYAIVKVASFMLIAPHLDPAKYTYIAGLSTGIFPAISLCIELIMLGLIFILLYSLLLHIGVLIAGGRNSVHETIKTGMYASVPLLFAGIIPLLGEIIAPIWILFIQMAGIRENQDLSTGKALLAVIFPVIVSGIFVAILAFLKT